MKRLLMALSAVLALVLVSESPTQNESCDSGCGFFIHRRHDVGVGVERDRDRCVTQAVRHDLRVDASREGSHRIGVPEVMQPDAWQLGRSRQEAEARSI